MWWKRQVQISLYLLRAFPNGELWLFDSDLLVFLSDSYYICEQALKQVEPGGVRAGNSGNVTVTRLWAEYQ